MKLSIVVPVYNVAEYLPKCVDSLLAQELTDCEILLVDDGSTDGKSGTLCDRYAAAHPEVIRVIHKPNGGLGDARNAGLSAAAGEYVLFVDSDDYLAPDTVRTLWPFMERGIDVTVFGCLVDSGGTITRPPEDRLPLGQVTDLAHFPELLLAFPSACNKLWRRTLFLEHGIRYPERVWYEDLATTGKLLAAAQTITAVDADLYYYVVREGSITRNSSAWRNQEIIDAVKNITEWYRANGIDQQYWKELEALSIIHVYLSASVRVIKIRCKDVAEKKTNRQIIHMLLAETERNHPAWHNNSYIRFLSKRHRIVLELLRYRQFWAIDLIFRVRNHQIRRITIS
ncbi:MAG: glycosyltransferase [Oscillospiraceae bacterium]|nr:glycosyltransferase [Oscillospiraceae bacterium]